MRRLEKYFPPGYEYEAEVGLAVFLWGGTVCVSVLYFAFELYYAINKLYQSIPYAAVGYRRVLREGARVEAFAELVEWYWALWLPALLFLAALPLLHYFYYYHDSRSIYVMRRLPQRGVTFKSCVRGPALGAGIVLGAAVLLYVLYFGIYCLGVPGECMPRLV